VIPAIDIMNGEVVRLLRGNPKQVKSYAHLGDPITIARKWESEGAKLIHVVDLDAALGLGENINIIGAIVRSIKAPIQVGGGIRSVEQVRQLINAGVARAVLGSLAFRSVESLKALLEEFGDERIVVALDHLDGVVMIDGWRKSVSMTLKEAAQFFKSLGVRYFLVTSIQRDGMMVGPDIKNLSKIVDLGVNVIASGGIRSLSDISMLRSLGVYGVIIGRALYEGLFTLKEALNIAEGKK
jgi:phosphoribosylformimino-5-aminoimidazole carboxamide ribotide isomerase